MRLIFVLIWLPLLSLSQPDTARTHGTIKIQKKYSEVDHWPRIGSKMHGDISRQELCGNLGISTVYPYEILSFKLKNSYLKDSSALTSNGPFLSDDMCRVIHALPNGAIIHLEDIVVRLENGKIGKLNALRFRLTGKRD